MISNLCSKSFVACVCVCCIVGELFTYGYDISKPHVYYHVVSKEGVMSEATVITLPRGVLMHDFSITENYAIFMDLPLTLQPEVKPTLHY